MEEVNLKDLLQQFYAEKGYDFDPENNESLYETFECFSEKVEMDLWDRRRWYTIYSVVCKLTVGGKDYYFADQCWDAHNDSSASDCGWEVPDVSDIVQVFPKQVLTTVYVTKDKL